MSKSILIIGAGEGLSASIAKKFSREGYSIGLISRNAKNLTRLTQHLLSLGIHTFSAAADAGDSVALTGAIQSIQQQMGGIDVLFYNAAAVRGQDIMTESSESLSRELMVNAGGALDSVKLLHNDLKQAKGAVLLTGGGLANHPHPMYGSISLGKAALRNLSIQLHERLKQDNIYVGTLTINNVISPDSTTHSPEQIAEQFWSLFFDRNAVERQY